MSTELALVNPADNYRMATDVAGVCKEIVLRTAMEIQQRKYVKVEGWQALAAAHGCIASSKDVERVDGGFRAIGEVRRASDGALLAQAEGFVGEDEPTWFGGESEVYNRNTRQREKKMLPKRPDYAIRAMAQTRAISRACRSAFAHVVVLMDAGLQTTPAEEVPHDGFNDDHHEPREERNVTPREQQPATLKDWKTVEIHFGKNKGTPLAELNMKSLRWYKENYESKDRHTREDDRLYAAVCLALDGGSNPVAKAEQHAATEETIPTFNGEHHERLWEQITKWDGLTLEQFMEVATKQKLVKATTFDQITETEAKAVLNDWVNVLPLLQENKQ